MAKHKRTTKAVNIHRYHVATYWSLETLTANEKRCNKCPYKPINSSIKESLFIAFHNLGEIMLGEQLDDFVCELQRQGLKIERISQ